MKPPLFFLALLTLLTGALFAQEVEKRSEPQTLLFIRTVPEGARVLIDGKKAGATDDLFRVEPGIRRIVIELDGHAPQSKELTIRAGQITRLVLQLKKSQSPTGAAVSKTTDAVAPALKAVINDADSMQGREAIDLDHAQLFNLPDANGWSRQQRDDWLADNNIDLVAEYENNLWTLMTRDLKLNPIGADRWDTVTATELNIVLSEDNSATNHDIEVREQRGFRFHTIKFGVAAPVTFAFKTAEGSAGVMRIVEFSKLSKRPRSMTVLFKLLKPLDDTSPPTKVRVPDTLRTPVNAGGGFDEHDSSADAVIPLPPPKTGLLSFGPVIERRVKDDKTGKDWMIDLDTGKLYTPPTELDPEKNPQADTGKLMAWVRQRGIDATGIKAQGGELQFLEKVLAVVNEASWESVTQQQVRDALAEVVDPSDKAIVGDTLYAFRTREGAMGVLQVVGRGEDSPSVKFRYKLLRTARNVATDFLTAMRDKDDEALKALATDAVTQGWKEALPHFAAELRHHLEVFSKSTDPLTKIEEVVVDGDLAIVKAASVKQGYLVLFFQRTSDGWRNSSLKNSPPNVPLVEHMRQYKAEFHEADAQPGIGEVDRSSNTADDVPPGWKVVQRIDVPADQRTAIGKRLGGRIEKLSNDVYLAHGVRVQVNVMKCATAEDATKIRASVLKMKGDPAYCLLMDRTVVEFVGRFDVDFAKRMAHELLGEGPASPSSSRPEALLSAGQRDRARAQALLSERRLLLNAIEMYRLEHDKYPKLRDGWAELTQPDGDKGPFIKDAPRNPFTGGSTVATDDSGDWQYDPKTHDFRAVVPFGKEKADSLGLTSEDVVTGGETEVDRHPAES